MAKLQMFPVGEDKKQFAKRQALHDEQLRVEQEAREKLYPPHLSKAEFKAKREQDIADAEESDAEAIARSKNYIDPDLPPDSKE